MSNKFIFARLKYVRQTNKYTKIGWFACHALNTQCCALFCAICVWRLSCIVDQFGLRQSIQMNIWCECECLVFVCDVKQTHAHQTSGRFHLESDFCLYTFEHCFHFSTHIFFVFRVNIFLSLRLTLFYWPLNKLFTIWVATLCAQSSYLTLIQCKLVANLLSSLSSTRNRLIHTQTPISSETKTQTFTSIATYL